MSQVRHVHSEGFRSAIHRSSGAGLPARISRRVGAAAFTATVAVLFAGCGSSEDNASEEDSSGTTTEAESTTSTTAAATTAAPSTTAASGGSGVMDGVPTPTGATEKSSDSLSGGGEHVYYTASESATDFVSAYDSQLSGAGWTVEGSGGGGSSYGGDAGLTATNGDRYLVLQAGGPGGETFADLCVWPEKPSNDDCGDDDSDDDDSDDN